jgi:hypothetical protein
LTFPSEDQADALVFLARVRPLEGCSYDGDKRFTRGRQLILRWLAACAIELKGPTPKEVKRGLSTSRTTLEPLTLNEGEGEWDPGLDYQRARCGHSRTLQWIETRLVRVSGFDAGTGRPNETSPEEQDVERAAEKRRAQAVLQ